MASPAILKIIKKKAGRDLREWVFLGVRTGMRRGAQEYQLQKSANLPQAILLLKRAVDLPTRGRAIIQNFISTTPNGSEILTDGLALCGNVTKEEINAELTSLESYALNLRDRAVDGESWDSIAADIETNIEMELDLWSFPLPTGYTDIFGE